MTKTAAGHGSATLITGAAGSGKTRLLSAAALYAQTSGLLVVRTALRKQRGLSSNFLHDVVSGLRQVAPAESERASLNFPLVRAAMGGGAKLAHNRAELLQQVEKYVREVASARPLLLTIDDLQHADELAGGLVAALAHHAGDCALAIVATHDDQGGQASVLTIARGLAGMLQLEPLDRAQTIMLTASLFGDVPNVERIADWFFDVARGNPKITLELAHSLLARGTLRYVDGSWVLPTEIDEPLPEDTANALLRRLSALGANARGLAELLSVRRAGASTERLLAVTAPQPANAVFRALEELVRLGILESAGHEYAFVQEPLRMELAQSLDPARRQELHERWAKHLLAQRDQDESSQLEAGWHLVHTKDELRGAELLAKVAPNLVDRRESMATALPAMVRALEVFERHDQALPLRIRLRAFLVLSSYLFDYRLAARYSEQTLDMIYPHTGLAEGDRYARWFGRRLGFMLGLAWTGLRRLFVPAKRRGPRVLAALKYYAMSTMGLLGLRALAIDADGVEGIFERMRVFERAPRSTLEIVFLAAQAIRLHGLGRGAEVHHNLEVALARLGSDRNKRWHMTRHEHMDLLIGLLLAQGINEAYRERSRSLECAAKLDRIGSPLAVAASLRVSMTYYLLRGDSERSNHFRRLLDLKAIENGSSWQVEWIAAPLEGLAAAIWGDLLGMRRALDRLDVLTEQEPAFALMRDSIRLPYLFRRGDFAQVVEHGEAFMLRHPPLTRNGWALSYSMVALAYVELGNAKRALEICQTAFSHVTEADREYYVMYTPLEAAYAAALALTGQFESSEEIFRARSARMDASGEPGCVAVMYEYRIKVARLRGDGAAVQEATAELNAAALSSRNPGIVALAHRLGQERSLRPNAGELPRERLSAMPETVSHTVSEYLAAVASPEARAQQALSVLGHYAGCSEGYLYLERDASLQLTAALDERTPPDSLRATLQLMAAANDTQGCTQVDGDFCAYRLDGGFAVFRAASTASALLPQTLLSEVGLSLRLAAGART